MKELKDKPKSINFVTKRINVGKKRSIAIGGVFELVIQVLIQRLATRR